MNTNDLKKAARELRQRLRDLVIGWWYLPPFWRAWAAVWPLLTAGLLFW